MSTTTTVVTTRQVLPNVVVSTLTDRDDDGRAYVFCSVPGGRPRYCMDDPSNPNAVTTSIVNAPVCDDRDAVHAFVVARFGDAS